MATRPEILFPLFSSIASLKGVGPQATINFQRIGIEKIRDIWILIRRFSLLFPETGRFNQYIAEKANRPERSLNVVSNLGF